MKKMLWRVASVALMLMCVGFAGAKAGNFMGAEGDRTWEDELMLADHGNVNALEVVAMNYALGNFDLRDYAKAEVYLKEWIKKDPINVKPYLTLAELYLMMEDEAKATLFYDRACDLGSLAALNGKAEILPDDNAKELYRKVIAISKEQPQNKALGEDFAKAVIGLRMRLNPDKTSERIEQRQLQELAKDPRVFNSNAYSNDLFTYIEWHPGTALPDEEMDELLDRLTNTADGLSRLLMSPNVYDIAKDAAIITVEDEVLRCNAAGSYAGPEEEIERRDKAYVVATHLAGEKDYKRALPLMLYAAERGNLWAARDLGYYVYGTPTPDLGGGAKWPTSYRNAAKAQKWQEIFRKFFIDGPSGV